MKSLRKVDIHKVAYSITIVFSVTAIFISTITTIMINNNIEKNNIIRSMNKSVDEIREYSLKNSEVLSSYQRELNTFYCDETETELEIKIFDVMENEYTIDHIRRYLSDFQIISVERTDDYQYIATIIASSQNAGEYTLLDDNYFRIIAK